MSTAAPAPAAPAAGESNIGQSILGAIEGLTKKLETPDLTRIRRREDELGAVESYIGITDETVEVGFGDTRDAQIRKSYWKSKRESFRQLKSVGYVPGGTFKSFSHFLREGLSATHGEGRVGASSRFIENLRAHLKGIPGIDEITEIKAIQGMSETVGTDGGFAIMPEFAPGIIDRVYANDLFSRTDNYAVTGNNMTFLTTAETSRATGSRAGGLQGYWVPEGTSITKSKPGVRRVTMQLMKLCVVIYFTDELLADQGTALQQWVNKKAGEEFNFMIGDSIINGTGLGMPLGILNAPSLISVGIEGGQLTKTILTENIVKMYARFYAANLGNMVWLHNQDIIPQLDLMTIGVGTGGMVTYLPPGGLSAKRYATLRGNDCLPTEFNATLGTTGDIIASDLSQILAITKGGVMQAVSPHIEFLTDQLAIRLTMRLNLTPWETAPITPYKGSANTQSNFVALATR